MVAVLAACDAPQQGPAAYPPETAGIAESSPTGPVVDKPSAQEQPDTVKATSVTFEEVESGAEPYITRMLFSKDFIRIDDGPDGKDFILYDRQQKRIFSVVTESESILVVDPGTSLKQAPKNLEIRSIQVPDPDIPEISGHKPQYTQYSANNQLCYHVVASAELLPEVTQILREYRAVLAAQQQQIQANTPPELQTPCFLANYIYAPVRYLEHGFPVQQWDTTGYRRSLIAFTKDTPVDRTNFALPANYGFFNMGLDTDNIF